MILNIRGANGAGKTTAAKFFLRSIDGYDSRSEIVRLAEYETDKGKPKSVIGYLDLERSVCVVGSYATACGGMDTIPAFATARNAISSATERADHVICEGILASTVFGSWADYAKDCDKLGYPFAFCYLRVDAKTCLERIYARNGGKKIKEQLVHDKVKAIEGTRYKAKSAGLLVYDLPLGEGEAGPALWAIAKGEGEQYRAR